MLLIFCATAFFLASSFTLLSILSLTPSFFSLIILDVLLLILSSDFEDNLFLSSWEILLELFKSCFFNDESFLVSELFLVLVEVLCEELTTPNGLLSLKLLRLLMASISLFLYCLLIRDTSNTSE